MRSHTPIVMRQLHKLKLRIVKSVFIDRFSKCNFQGSQLSWSKCFHWCWFVASLLSWKEAGRKSHVAL